MTGLLDKYFILSKGNFNKNKRLNILAMGQIEIYPMAISQLKHDKFP